MKEKRRVAYRADASAQIGCGHFVRTLALAEMMKEDFCCTFYTSCPTASQVEQLEKVCPYVILSEENKLDEFLHKLYGDEIVVLDNYFFSPQYQKQIKDKGCKLICFGTNDRHYYSDVLINYAENDPAIFDVEPYTDIKLGIDWVILRKEFRRLPAQPRRKNHRIAVCFGGTDQFHLTEKTVDVIQQLPESYTVDLISSDRFGAERFEALQKRGVCCHINASAEEMTDVFAHCDFLVSSASMITHEGLACGLPVLCGYYVDNQKRMYHYFVDEHLVIGLSDMLSGDFPILLKDAITCMDERLAAVRPFSYGGIEKRYLSLFNSL